MCANMDTTGTFKMAEAFASQKMFTCIHKHYGVEDWETWSSAHTSILPYLAVSSGTSDADFAKVSAIMAVADVPFICIDVANGYSEVGLSFSTNAQSYLAIPFITDITPHHPPSDCCPTELRQPCAQDA